MSMHLQKKTPFFCGFIVTLLISSGWKHWGPSQKQGILVILPHEIVIVWTRRRSSETFFFHTFAHSFPKLSKMSFWHLRRNNQAYTVYNPWCGLRSKTHLALCSSNSLAQLVLHETRFCQSVACQLSSRLISFGLGSNAEQSSCKDTPRKNINDKKDLLSGRMTSLRNLFYRQLHFQ